MRLIRFGEFRRERPGIIDCSGARRDCSQYFNDWNHDFFQSGGLAELSKLSVDSMPLVDTDERWGSCVARPGKVICIGCNYGKHAKESGSDVPGEPLIFQKATNAVVGPYDDVLIPRRGEQCDWEIELAVIIGKDASYLTGENESDLYIAGYSIANDVSERSFQKDHFGQWTKGKSCDTFCPLGPFFATKDEVSNPLELKMRLELNGELRQDSCTGEMNFKPHFLISYLSQFMTLEAGDVILTGTPAGVGMGMEPPQFLRSGDVMSLRIDGLGEQRQTCRDA